MNIDWLDVKKCRYLVVVADELNFSKAAERLNMAQPPLSQQVKSIESRLGLKIFDRSTRSVKVTYQGQKIITLAKQLIESHRTIADALKHLEQRPILLGAIPLAFDAFLSEKIACIHKEAPDLLINLQEGGTTKLVQACESNELDAAIVRLHEADLPNRRVYPLKQEQYVVVYPKDWQIEQVNKQVCLSAFNNKRYISYPRVLQPDLFDKISAEFNKIGCESSEVQQVKSKAVTMSLVANGVGFAIVPVSIVKRFKDDVNFSPIKQILPTVDYYLYCKGLQLNSNLAQLLSLLKQ